ncbi:MAG: hypothetical protein VKI42_01670 [Synechococcaceae cyanobacterium]|nr:hypothetical protein [Synechococcaceae cyanobacterium]
MSAGYSGSALPPPAARPVSIRVTVTTGNLAGQAQAATRRAAEIVMGELFAAFQQSFTARAWDWPDDLPTRKLQGANLRELIDSYDAGEGVRAGNPRNLIDSGNLRQSGSWRMTGPYQATFKWSANYATAVHEGAMIYPWGNRDAERVMLPARPWTRAVLGQEQVGGIRTYNLGERLQNVWMAQLRRGR